MEEKAFLREMDWALASTPDLEEVLQLVIQTARRIFKVEAVSLALIEDNQLTFKAALKEEELETLRRFRLRLGQGIAGWVAEEGVPLLVSEARQDPKFYSEVDKATDFVTKSILCVPLKVNETIGVIEVLNKVEGEFTEEDLEVLTAISELAALSIENAQLCERIQRRVLEQEALREAGVAVAETLNLDETLERILRQLERVIPYDTASLQLLRDGYLEIVSGRGFPELEEVMGQRIPVTGDDLNERLIEGREPIVLPDARAAYHGFHLHSITCPVCAGRTRAGAGRYGREPPHKHIRSWLGVPLIVRDQVIGALAIDSSEVGHFREEHIRLVVPFANQAAIAIENARLYEAAQQEIAERKRAEEERGQMLEELEAKNKELESFTYSVSHELKAPLVSLDGFSSTLKKEFYDQLGQRGQHYLERIQANVAHMGDLISDLLELSRVGRVVGPTVEVDVAVLLRDIQEEMAGRLEEVGAELVVQDPMPTVRCDRGRIRQVFTNLIDNAIKFRSEERPLRIEVGCQEEWDFSRSMPTANRFCVSDNGIGIDPQYQEQIFAPFRQLDPKAEGVGMGLALIRKIVEHHGGRVWVKSEGEGSEFCFTLPQKG
ncbi:MAG: GAF domain-containing protein [Chloroflexota bacterium]|nr:GAF domain-containing protein [Chloroflexota bacterium]